MKWLWVFLKRWSRRVKFALRFREMWEWQYESCEDCGCNFRWCWRIPDSLWLKIYGSPNGTLCPSCAIIRAEQRGIQIQTKDFEALWVFHGGNHERKE